MDNINTQKGSTYFLVIAIISILSIQIATAFYLTRNQVQVSSAYVENANKHMLAYSGAEKAVELINSTVGEISGNADSVNTILNARFAEKNIPFSKNEYSFSFTVGDSGKVSVTIKYTSPVYEITSTAEGERPAVVKATATLQGSKIVMTSIKKIQAK